MGAVGVLLLVLGELHRQGDPRKIPYREFGGILIATVLMLTSFYGFNQEMLRGSWWGGYRHETPQVPLDLFAIAVSGLTIVLGVLGLQRAKQGAKTAEAVAQRRQFYLPIALGAAWAGVSLWTALLHDPLTPTILANLGMLALSWWLTQTGLREDRGRPFAAGIGYFLLWTVIRYIDLFGDLFGILGGAGMFFVCGATLYAVASYWQKRVKAQVPPTSRPNETWSVD